MKENFYIKLDNERLIPVLKRYIENCEEITTNYAIEAAKFLESKPVWGRKKTIWRKIQMILTFNTYYGTFPWQRDYYGYVVGKYSRKENYYFQTYRGFYELFEFAIELGHALEDYKDVYVGKEEVYNIEIIESALKKLDAAKEASKNK
jgi:hypothetical protein